MVRIATGDTGEQGLLRTILFGHMPTLGARLRGVAWVDCNHFAPTPVLFVFQHMPKHAPALIQNRLVQPSLLCHVLPWLLHRALRRPRHIADLQVLNHNNRVVFAGLCTELVQKIVAAVGNADVELGNTALLLLPVAGIFD